MRKTALGVLASLLFWSSWAYHQDALKTVGVLTMPPLNGENEYIRQGHYVTEMADIFMRTGGLFPVFIPYNISDGELYPLLDQLNGVFFTGGDLELYNQTTGQLHPYTVTGMKIFEYAIAEKDSGGYFPLLGICQGLELLHILAANTTNALGWSLLENAHVNTQFLDIHKDSKLFGAFEEDVLSAMAQHQILYHYHHRSVPVLHYLRFPRLQDFFRILSVNEIDGVYIAASVEAKNYPIYMTQYHPEVVLDPASDINTVRTPINYKVAFSFASFFGEECAKSDHRFGNASSLYPLMVKNGEEARIAFVSELVNAYGFDY